MLELPPLPRNLILLCEVGSGAHGTGKAGMEDNDEIGVVVESPTEIFGLDADGFRTVMLRTQPEGTRSGPGDTDRTLHSLRRFVRLAASGNPSILMVLWAPIVRTTDLGEELRELGPSFIGRHVIPRYRGYMESQGMRMLGLRASGHGRRGGGGREELIDEYGYDTKYAMHAARLGYQCLELLTTGKLNLPIQDEPAVWLRAVRYGAVEFEEWWERCLQLDAALEALEADDSLPSGPDLARIEAWLVSAHQRSWASNH